VGSDSYGGAFISTDGSSWSAASSEPFKAATTSVVASTSKGLLALGAACGSECSGFQSWLSKDGSTWSGPKGLSGDSARPTAVVEQGALIVAVSTELVDPSQNKYQGFVYVSSDATTWTEPPTSGTFDQTGLTGIAADGNGFVIVGSKLLPTGLRDGAAWLSGDAKTWTVASDDGSFKGALLQAIARGSGGYVAVGSIGADGATWTSSDGKTWARSDGGAFKNSPLADVASAGAGYIAIGRGPTGSAWTSADGKAWHAVSGIPGDADAKFLAVAVGQTRSSIIGQPLGSSPSGLVWLGPLP